MRGKKALHAGLNWKITRPAVDAVLHFANAPIGNKAEVERSLSHAAQVLGFGEPQPLRFVLDDGVLQPFFMHNRSFSYESEQKRLRRWLKKIVDWKSLRPRDRASVLAEILPLTERYDARLKSRVSGDKLVRSIDYGATSVEQVIGEVMYLIFEDGIAEEGGIAVCPGCNSYFVKDRVDQKVCSVRCRVRTHRRHNEG